METTRILNVPCGKCHQTSDFICENCASKEYPRWIPVTERLPEKNGYYLVSRRMDTSDGLPPLEVTMRQFYIKSGWQSVSEAYPVTHWMPLPQPPEEK